MGNGDTASGDGWKYRGRGAIQLTGKTNYLICGNAIGLDLQNSPDMLLDPQHGIRAALWFWNNHNLNKYADVQDMQTITKIINGGLNGLDDRLAYYNKALAVLRAA
jgi:putative chitinase